MTRVSGNSLSSTSSSVAPLRKRKRRRPRKSAASKWSGSDASTCTVGKIFLGCAAFVSVIVLCARSPPSEDDGGAGVPGRFRRQLSTKLRGVHAAMGAATGRTGGAPNFRHEPFPQSAMHGEMEELWHPLDAYQSTNTSDISKSPQEQLLSSVEANHLVMKVPKFWDPPTLARYGGIRKYLGDYGSRLMTPAEAKSIGSVITKQTNVDGTHEELETILVLFASFRDWMCPHSVELMFERAVHPERIRVAIVDQILEDDVPCSEPLEPCSAKPDQALCKYSDHVEAMSMNASLSTGPIFARHLGYRMYRGEAFVLQSDAHVQFAAGWDSDIIDQWKSTGNEMTVLTSYVSAVQDHIDEETGERLTHTRPIMCESDFVGEGLDRHLQHGEQPEAKPNVEGVPQLEPYWGAGFSFSRGHFVVNIPYDLWLPHVFQGEEINIGIRGFTYGYDYYAPERNALYHYYKRPPKDPNDVRVTEGEVPKYWDAPNYSEEVEVLAMVRLNDILHMTPSKGHSEVGMYWSKVEEQKYGLGSVRTPERFFDTFGIHLESQTIEMNLCMFIAVDDPGSMHNFFVKRLREDGMGIDYNQLNGFIYKNKYPKNWWWWYRGENPNDEDAYIEPLLDTDVA